MKERFDGKRENCERKGKRIMHFGEFCSAHRMCYCLSVVLCIYLSRMFAAQKENIEREKERERGRERKRVKRERNRTIRNLTEIEDRTGRKDW